MQAARPDADVAFVVKAYLSAESWHQGQLRKSGDPYITHPVAVARILVGLGADDPTLCAALLHDVLEDTACTEAELQTEFGSEIADLVHQASAPNPTDDKDAAALTALAAGLGGDRRVLFIKIADRLHNMRTIRYLPTAKQVDRSRQTLQVQVPEPANRNRAPAARVSGSAAGWPARSMARRMARRTRPAAHPEGARRLRGADSARDRSAGRDAPGQPMAYTTVTETLSCAVPDEIGTDGRGAAPEADAYTGNGWAGAWSVMLTTGPSG